MVVGALFSVLPNLLWWVRIGRPVWIADEDEIVYLAIAGQAYDHHPFHLSDPVKRDGPSLCSWLQIGPGVLLAKALGLGPMGVGLAWRIWAGIAIPVCLYILIRQYVERPGAAAALTIFLLADAGMVHGRPLSRQLYLLAHLIRGNDWWLRGFFTASSTNYQWRVVTPAMVFGFLLVYVWLLGRACRQPTWPRILGAGVAFGLLFYAHFHYWTAAGLGLVLGMLVDAGRRRVYFHTGWIGGLIGLPTIIASALLRRTRSADTLLRFDVCVSINRFSEIVFSRWETVLLAVCLVYVWFRRRDLIHLGALAAAGWLLVNHQVLTGLQVQNFHWRGMVYGPCLTLLVILLIVGKLPNIAIWPRWALAAALAVLGLHISAGLYLRAMEALHAQSSVKEMALYRAYRGQRFPAGAARLAPEAVVAGDEGFIDMAMVLERQRPLDNYMVRVSLSVDNTEWHARAALNGYLRGLDRSAFEAEQPRAVGFPAWGPWSRERDPARFAKVIAERMAAYDAVRADPQAALNRFHVRYVALPAASSPPNYLESGWQRLEASPHWQVWERLSTSAPKLSLRQGEKIWQAAARPVGNTTIGQ